jgi:tetratricopeptide (TPR) repeat protein
MAIRSETRTRIARLTVALLLCLTGLGYFLHEHYRFSWPLVRVTPRGVTGLIAYELGYYKEAAHLWRAMSGLEYDPTALPQLVQAASAVIAREPGNPENYLWLADLHVALGDYEHAATAYRRALQRRPDLADATIGLATVRLLEGAHPEARARLEEVFDQAIGERHLSTFLNFLLALDALVHAPGSSSADRYLTLAYAYRYLAIFDHRHYQTVISYSARALQLDPNQADAYFCAGVAYTKLGKIDLAIQQFRSVVRILPGKAEAYKRLGFLHGLRGDLEQELSAYRNAAAASPDNPRYLFELGSVLLKKYGDLKQAATYLRAAHDLDPEQYDYGIHLAYTLKELRQYPEALAIYDAVVRGHPRRAEAYEFQARCLLSLGRYADVVGALQRAQALEPLPFWSVRDLAAAYSRLNRMDDAIAAEEAALQRVPHDVDTLYDLQSLYRRVGRYADAYRAVRQI